MINIGELFASLPLLKTFRWKIAVNFFKKLSKN